MANRVPLVFDTTDSKIKELPSGDNLNMSGSSINDAINISASGVLTATTTNTININIAGNPIAEVAKTNDYNDLSNLPVLFDGDYNSLTNKPVSTATDWADVTNKPVIASKLSQLVNDTNFVTNAQVAIQSTQVAGLASVATGGSWTDLVDANQLVTKSEITGGTLTIDVNNTGDLEGSVFSTDGIIKLVDGDNKRLNGPLFGNVTGNLTGDTTGDHIGNVYSQDGAKQVLYSGATQNDDALFRGNIAGQVFSSDLSTLVIGEDGNFYGDVKGSVFADDSSVIVDGINGSVNANNIYAGTLRTNSIVSEPQLQVLGDSAVQILATGANGLVDINGFTVSISSNDASTYLASGDLNVVSTNGILNLNGNGSVNITSGELGAYADLDIFAATTTISSNEQGGAIYLGMGPHVDFVSTADALSFTLPTYLDATERDTAITSPVGGEMVYLSSTGKFTGYNGQTSTWNDLN